jgi:hypothetical protein
LVIEQQIVVFPESILIGCAFTGFCCPYRFWPKKGEMLVTKADRTVLDIFFVYLARRASGKLAAVWSLKVAKFNDGNRSVLCAHEMTGLGDHIRHHLLRVCGLRLRTGCGWLGSYNSW